MKLGQPQTLIAVAALVLQAILKRIRMMMVNILMFECHVSDEFWACCLKCMKWLRFNIGRLDAEQQ
jgi:hypothetical protein